MRKLIGIILAFVVVAFTASPLVNEIIHSQDLHSVVYEMDCCDICADDCVMSTDADKEMDGKKDCGDHDCKSTCKCSIYSPHTFTVYFTPEISLSEVFLDAFDEITLPYRFALPAKIWQPPRA